ncbi:methyltransferase domain-containing protein [Edaphobacter dinghuensis]|uniref:Methyltransferase family protein n=1 Tax=Edaphobacter dinghuensis TaxID=1560005 RepID=A0A917M9S7_9BACT|nr:methyltransferase domain-containing protein [Edaphobacter dinghuensis]GGG86656.1 hypothetical protein GCM10011585_33280 [Edaphobacter dinghuensis]
MSKLTKQQAALHAEACELLRKDVLTDDDRLFVLDHWQESANHINGLAGAFFTPTALARDFAIETFGGRILDLCAGIGSLAYAAYSHSAWSSDLPQITCVEINPDYIAVGKKILPEATWVRADVLDLPPHLTGFDCVIANPPFGRIKQPGKAPRYSGSEFEYKVIDIASDRAKHGVFIVPQSSAPFRLSGRQTFLQATSEKYQRFVGETSIELEPNCGIDTSVSAGGWKGASVITEIVLADFEQARSRRIPQRMFSMQAELFADPDRLAA